MASSSLICDCVGIGIGPSNLSLACLLDPIKNFRCCFLEQNSKFIWHQGLLLEDTSIQISILKDLVSLVNPRSQYSFVSFLHEKNRLYHFINANFSTARRTEFNQYFQWICSKLNNLKFSHRVEEIKFDQHFHIETKHGLSAAKNIVLGIGRVPFLPLFAKNLNNPTVFHASDFLNKKLFTRNKKIAVVGGGQSGAEIFLNLLSSSKENAPSSCIWISRKSNFFPLDDSSFTNEFFMPIYSNHFTKLSEKIKNYKLREQSLINNGISLETIKEIYQAIYQNNFLSSEPITIKLMPNREVKDIEPIRIGWKLIAKHIDTEEYELFDVDIVILATGYAYEIPQFLNPLLSRLKIQNNELVIRDDFSAIWDGAESNRIYVQNFAINQKGIADPNLSLMAWRSAKIINSLMNKPVYREEVAQSLISWESDSSSKDIHSTPRELKKDLMSNPTLFRKG